MTVPLHETAEGLITALRQLGDEYGPLGVASAAAQLTDVGALTRNLVALDPSKVGRVFAEQAAAVLDRMNDADPTATRALIDARVSCNDALADDATVQVGIIDADVGTVVGLLGVVNGICGTYDDADGRTPGYVQAHYGDDGTLIGFGVAGTVFADLDISDAEIVDDDAEMTPPP